MVQAKDGRLQQQEAGDEEEAEPQGKVVALAPLGGVEGVKGGDDAPRQLRLHRLGSFLWTITKSFNRRILILNISEFYSLLNSSLLDLAVIRPLHPSTVAPLPTRSVFPTQPL